MDKKVNYGHLRKVLEKLGYHALDLDENNVVFRNPDRRLFISLPKMPALAAVTPTDMLRVRLALVNDGVIKEKDYEPLFRIKKGDRLILNDPSLGGPIEVTAAAGESDGFVVIKLNGAFTPCPIDRLQEDWERATGTGTRR